MLNPKAGKSYTITSIKASSSYGTIPIPNFLLNDFMTQIIDDANYYGFRDSWYVFGNINPLTATTLLDRKTKMILWLELEILIFMNLA